MKQPRMKDWSGSLCLLLFASSSPLCLAQARNGFGATAPGPAFGPAPGYVRNPIQIPAPSNPASAQYQYQQQQNAEQLRRIQADAERARQADEARAQQFRAQADEQRRRSAAAQSLARQRNVALQADIEATTRKAAEAVRKPQETRSETILHRERRSETFPHPIDEPPARDFRRIMKDATQDASVAVVIGQAERIVEEAGNSVAKKLPLVGNALTVLQAAPTIAAVKSGSNDFVRGVEATEAAEDVPNGAARIAARDLARYWSDRGLETMTSTGPAADSVAELTANDYSRSAKTEEDTIQGINGQLMYFQKGAWHRFADFGKDLSAALAGAAEPRTDEYGFPVALKEPTVTVQVGHGIPGKRPLAKPVDRDEFGFTK
jgi:hypothetical protein